VFAWWGRTVYRYRFMVIGVMVALSLLGGVFGISLGKHVTQSGFYDEGSQSVKASVLGDTTYGRDRTSHIVAVFTAPKSLNDPAWQKKMVDELNAFKKDHPDQVVGWAGWLAAPTSTDPIIKGMASEDGKHTFVSIPLKGDNDDTILTNYKDIEPDLQKLNDGKVQLAGLEPIANALTGTIGTDQKRMEVLALPLVAVVLFLVFGGVIAASLPAIVGGLSIAGSLGILRFMAEFGPVHFFAQPVVSMMGFGIAIDYGLFIVSRFREEIAEGYDTEAAVRRTVMTAGRTVAFSATLIAVSAASLFLLPQGFVKSLTYAVIISVSLAAVLSITLLPACLAILGSNVDALGVRTLFRIPFLANWTPSRVYLNWLADRLQKTKTREEVEAGFWGKLVNVVMKRPLVFAIPIIIGMIVLILPLHNLSFGGGISETYLPPDNPVRLAQQNFDKVFPGYRTSQLTLVIESDNHSKVTDQQVAEIRNDAASITGFTDTNWQERACPTIEGNPCVSTPNGSHPKDDSVRVIQNGLAHASDAAKKLAELRSMSPPRGLTVLVGGVPALEQDSIHSLAAKAPLMAVVLLSTTMLLMFLAFGSVVLPIKAAVMSALTLGSTLGILTWIFVDGHFANLLNFTPAPLMIVIIALVVAVGFGLATDYEVFLVSRMVEARARGMSTAEAIRIGTATTGRLITAAALVLAVVAGSFAFSDLMMMQCLAFGLMAALLLDATVVRMFLVPSVMKLLGDDCWWAPHWMKRLQNRLGLGEIHLPDERKVPSRARSGRPATTTRPPIAPTPRPPHDPTHPNPEGGSRPARPPAAPTSPRPDFRPPAPEAPSAAGTTRMSAPGRTEPKEAPTTRFSAQPTPPAAPPAPVRPPTPPAPPQPPRGEDREIESWLSDLRGGKTGDPRSAAPKAPQPSADETRALQIPPRDKPAGPPPTAPEDATTAIPAAPREDKDADPATEKLNASGEKPRPRRGGGLSAQDLLRREGRI
jgi:uncharacterized membrane protein YdfJ with MMPL/SSD domain